MARLTVLLLSILNLPVLATAQISDPRPALPPPPALGALDPSWDGDEIDDYMERQHEHTLHAVETVLRQTRPAYPEPQARRLAMLALDEALHYDNPNSNASAAVKNFLKMRTDVASDEFSRTTVREGAVVWKLYNHAFVVKTSSATVAFDLTRGFWGRSGNHPEIDDSVRRIIDGCDVLFFSHNHEDHLDDVVKDTFLAQGKPVIVSSPDIYADDQRITRLRRDSAVKQRVPLKDGRHIDVIVFPGYQGEMPNSVVLVFTPDEISFAHTGDLFKGRSTPEDMWQWIDSIKDRWEVDMLMVNIWTTDLKRVIQGFDPNLVISGHENELGHSPLKRKSNYLVYDKLPDCNYPWVLMTWGESYYYRK